MNVWMDGLAVLADQARAVFSILAVLIWGQLISIELIKRLFKDDLTSSEYFSLGMTGWVLPLFLWAVLSFWGFILFGDIAAPMISILAVTGLLYAWFSGKSSNHSFSVVNYILIFFLVIFMVLRLAFLRQSILPMYFDSAEHYRIIKYFTGYFALPGGSPLSSYYHVGYHFLNATVSHVFQLGIVDTMLVFGQIVLAVLPVSMFFTVKQETRSNSAAFFACLLVGIGWHMPSHSMDWGKYPALFSLVGICFVLNIGYLFYRNNKYKTDRLGLYVLLGFGVLISTLIHTRALIIFVFMTMSMLLTKWRGRLPIVPQHLVFALVICTLAIQIVLIQSNTALAPLFGVYLGQDLFATGLVIFLFIFSAQAFADLTFFLLVMLVMMMAGLFVPVTVFPNYGVLTLLDRPYVQMLFYFPLSIFGGLGLAGLHQFLQRFTFHSKRLSQVSVLFVFGFIVLNAKVNQNFYPSNCCQIVSRDDLTALQWMDHALPFDANVLIASTELFVTSFEPTEYRAGVDGGVWIPALTSKRIIFMDGDLNFALPEIHAEICRQNVTYIYVGSMPLSFNALQLDGQPDWYQNIFFLPKAKIYQAIGCG